MSSASLDLEASLLQRWFPVSPPGSSTLAQSTRFSETDLRGISDVLKRVGRGPWSRIPRIFTVLRLLDRLDVIDHFLAQAISDVYFPFTHRTLPQSLNPSIAHEFLQLQRVVLSSALDLERETGRHRHFSSTNDVPFIKVEELGKGAYGFVDRVISTVSYKEYARKLIPRGRTFQRDQKILRDFERELGTLKKLSHHRHIVQLIGSYTDPRFVGILMSPVAECDLKDFLHNCVSDVQGTLPPSKSFIRSFFGCLTSALSYLHDNTVRHKDLKPQNVLVSQHTVFLTDFGISLDWSEIGQSTTTGPTPRTARYCAPEVSDCAPRNSSSDMWSLGCIFLEIWTVLKGETISNLHAFLEATNTKSSCYHLNCEATSQWMNNLKLVPILADDLPQDWIRHLIVPNQRERWTARQLLSEIETVNTNPEVKFAFSGQCCMDELESADSVISSDESFHESDVDGTILPRTLPVSRSVSKLAQEKQLGARDTMPTSHVEFESSHIDDVPALDLQAIETTTMPSALDELEGQEIREANRLLLAIDKPPEKNLHPDALDSDRVLLPTDQSSPEATNKDSPLIKAPEPHNDVKVTSIEQAFKPPADIAPEISSTTSERPKEELVLKEEISTKPSLKPISLTGTGTARPATSVHENTSHSRDRDGEGQVSNISASTDRGSQKNIIRDLDAKTWLSAVHSQSSSFGPPVSEHSAGVPELMAPIPVASHSDITGTTKDLRASLISGKGVPDLASYSHSGENQPIMSRPRYKFREGRENRAPQPSSNTASAAAQLVPKKPSPAPEHQSKRVCARCSEVLTGQFVRALSNIFHLECFTCVDCNQIVAHNFFPSPGKITGGKFVAIAGPPEGHTEEVPFCELDYFRRLDLVCHACGKALRGSYIQSFKQKYHAEHFVCEEPGCVTILGLAPETSYYEHKDKAYCEPHYIKFHADLCHGCGIAILKQFVGKTEHWHPECYMIYRYWALQLKNEFAEFFAKHEHPRENGLDVPQLLVEGSKNRSGKLINRVFVEMSRFEESCATSLSGLIPCISQSNRLKAMSICGRLIFRIEGLFTALDEVDRVKMSKIQQGMPSAREQKRISREIMQVFGFRSTMSTTISDTNTNASKELHSLLERLAENLKILIRIGLAAAWSSESSNKEETISAFLSTIERNSAESSIELKLYEKIRGNDYIGTNADRCYLCQKLVDGEGTMRTASCYWTHNQVYHIDCIKCPACNGSPMVVYTTKDDLSVDCSRCNHGSILAFISQNLGPNFVILHSRSLVWLHVLYIAWARLVQTLKPDTALSLLYAEEFLSSNVEKTFDESSRVYDQKDRLLPPPPCPYGWKALWSKPARRYYFVDLRTGISHWELPKSSDTPSPSSYELTLHRPAPEYEPQDPENLKPRDSNQESLAPEDLSRLNAVEQPREGGSGSSLPPDWTTTVYDMMSEEKEKSGFFKWIKKW